MDTIDEGGDLHGCDPDQEPPGNKEDLARREGFGGPPSNSQQNASKLQEVI
jgi:hypothetical protein